MTSVPSHLQYPLFRTRAPPPHFLRRFLFALVSRQQTQRQRGRTHDPPSLHPGPAERRGACAFVRRGPLEACLCLHASKTNGNGLLASGQLWLDSTNTAKLSFCPLQQKTAQDKTHPAVMDTFKLAYRFFFFFRRVCCWSKFYHTHTYCRCGVFVVSFTVTSIW